MRHRSRRDLAALLGSCSLLLGLAGCFNPDYGDSGFKCETGKCPAGYTCQGPPGARLCVRDGVKPRVDSVVPSPDQASRVDRSPVEDWRQSLEPNLKNDSRPNPDRPARDTLPPKLDGCLTKCWCTTDPALPNGCGGTCPVCPTCCAGNTCCPAGHVCASGACCKPLTCNSVPCGLQGDGCGAKIDCPCPGGQVCENQKCVTPCSNAGGPCQTNANCCSTNGLICGVAKGICCYASGSSCPASGGGSCCTGFCQNGLCF